MELLMAELTFEGFITKLRQQIRNSYQTIGDNLISGGAKDMETYKYLLGQAHAYQIIDQEISNLLNPKEEKKWTKTRQHQCRQIRKRRRKYQRLNQRS
jgi:uncharacterized protein YaaN involved in tellurite resistance